MLQLYGGAVTASVTTSDNIVDVSKIREVPDTQEVFMLEGKADELGQYDKSLIFELLERVDLPDQEALGEHLEDMVGHKAPYKLVEKFTNSQGHATVIGALAQENDRKDNYKEGAPVAVLLLTALVRLEKTSTDVLISLNVPVKSKSEDFPLEAVKLLREAADTYTVKDWGLFGE